MNILLNALALSKISFLGKIQQNKHFMDAIGFLKGGLETKLPKKYTMAVKTVRVRNSDRLV